MVDRERVLSKIDELDGYLAELKEILPTTFLEYQKIEKKRSCERLLQLAIECVIDICKLHVRGLKLGLPAGENDLFEKMLHKEIITPDLAALLKEMRAFRNILIHEYAVVDDRLVFEKAGTNMGDFEKFKQEIRKIL
ncbi:MAG: DUF86 domain-containing protein [Candidatus Omnitrophica bacterium]|nr:DUF86 domain-containing protein [Candidatus Omnitrophota bacterium]